jgi:hypothetical protein
MMADDPRRGSAVKLANEQSASEQQLNDGAAQPPRHRRTRKPFGSQQQKLAWPPIEGFHLHWFNEEPGRIERAKEAGYEHVVDADGKSVHRIVGVGRDNKGMNAYLMKLPQDWYDEDMAIEQQKPDAVDKSIEHGEVEGKHLSKDDKGNHFYVGAQGIKLNRGLQIRRTGTS